MKYALVKNGQVDRVFRKRPTALKTVSNLWHQTDDQLRDIYGIYPVNTVVPPFDPATQVKDGVSYTINVTDVTETVIIRDKTQAELDAEQAELDRVADDFQTEGALEAKDKVSLRILFNQENRIRVLEGRPEITRQQFMQAARSIYRGLMGG